MSDAIPVWIGRALAFALVACGGQVEVTIEALGDGPGLGLGDAGPPDSNTLIHNPPDGTDGGVGANRAPDGGMGSSDALIFFDASGFAGESTGPPPACSLSPLSCGAPFPGETAFATAQDVANAIVGRWQTCAGGWGGEEFAADGTHYQLRGQGASLQRNLDPTTIGRWDVGIFGNPGGVASIAVYVSNVEGIPAGASLLRTGGLSACPPYLVTDDTPTTYGSYMARLP
jgi:hypothetical protein